MCLIGNFTASYKTQGDAGVVVYLCNLRFKSLKQVEYELEANLGYTVRSC